MEIVQLPVLMDNYAYFVTCPQTGKVGLIDSPDAVAILDYLRREGKEPSAILNTHHHWDHAGGNKEICEQFEIPVYCSEYDQSRIDKVTKTLKEGDHVQVGGLDFKVFDVPGHTLGHLAYYGHGVLFCGDTLFVGGCGRLFEGSAEQMQASLNKLRQLPDETKIYCAHEYTEQNLSFALSIEPGNKALQAKFDEVKTKRAQNLSTVPSTLGEEKSYNPFLRWDSVEIIESLKKKGCSDLSSAVKVFAAVRKLKDDF